VTKIYQGERGINAHRRSSRQIFGGGSTTLKREVGKQQEACKKYAIGGVLQRGEEYQRENVPISSGVRAAGVTENTEKYQTKSEGDWSISFLGGKDWFGRARKK